MLCATYLLDFDCPIDCRVPVIRFAEELRKHRCEVVGQHIYVSAVGQGWLFQHKTMPGQKQLQHLESDCWEVIRSDGLIRMWLCTTYSVNTLYVESTACYRPLASCLKHSSDPQMDFDVIPEGAGLAKEKLCREQLKFVNQHDFIFQW